LKIFSQKNEVRILIFFVLLKMGFGFGLGEIITLHFFSGNFNKKLLLKYAGKSSGFRLPP